jgi:hypothetical protein
MSLLKKGDWRTPEDLPFNINSVGSETSLAFSPSGNEVYFVSNEGKDNIGGHDIYFITKTDDKKWSKPQNCGSEINSAYDEQAVNFSASGDTLWFSSKGHTSIGGFDIFYSVRNPDGRWGQAINAGYPLNTPWDDMFHSTSPASESIFYFSSNRSGGFGGLDIYTGRISGSAFSVPSPETETEQIQSESPVKED